MKSKKIPVIYVFLVVFLGIASLFLTKYFFNRQIIHSYSEETNAYIEENKEGLKYIYSNLFDQTSHCIDVTCFEGEIRAHIKDNIQDFNTMYFIKLIQGRGEQSIGQLSTSGSSGGQTTDWWITPSIYNVNRLLHGKITEPILWKNDFASYDTEGVVIPVKIDNVLLGAIVRKKL
jgi:hypothetical protein